MTALPFDPEINEMLDGDEDLTMLTIIVAHNGGDTKLRDILLDNAEIPLEMFLGLLEEMGKEKIEAIVQMTKEWEKACEDSM